MRRGRSYLEGAPLAMHGQMPLRWTSKTSSERRTLEIAASPRQGSAFRLRTTPMRFAHAFRNRLARRTRFAAARLLAGAVAALLLTAHGVRGQEATRTAVARFAPQVEVWVCVDHKGAPQDGRPPLELVLKDGLLIEQPLGSPRYQLLADNDYAMIGVDHHADFEPVLGMVNIFVSTVTIDKSTGNFAIATTVGDKVSEHRTGRCRKFHQFVAPVSGTTLARRN